MANLEELRPQVDASVVSRPIHRVASRGIMGLGGALVFGGIWIDVFTGALLRIGTVGVEIIGYQWPALGAEAVLVAVGAVLGRRGARGPASRIAR